MLRSLFPLIIFATFCSCAEASAVRLPDAQLYIAGDITLTGNNNIFHESRTIDDPQFHASIGGQSGNTLKADANGSPSLRTTVYGGTGTEVYDYQVGVLGGLSLTYHFELAGPVTQPVKLRVSGFLQASVLQSQYYADSQANADLGISNTEGANWVINQRGDGAKTQRINNVFDAYTNFDYTVVMGVSSSVGLSSYVDYNHCSHGECPTVTTQGSATAFADPTFYLASQLPDAADYAFVFSSGVGNGAVSPVPLPASAPMFGLALLGVGAIGLRRKCSGRQTGV